jgi:Domain of unknown function (DUF5134)
VTTSPWFCDGGALAMLGIGSLYAVRICVGIFRRAALSWDAELVHLGMGLAMAGMLDKRLAVAPPLMWLAFFCAAGAWFALRNAVAARRQPSSQLLGSTLVHVGGCAAMVYMLAVVPSMGSMVDLADLICGSRTLGMRAATGSVPPAAPWAGPALALGVVLLAGVACTALARFRPFGAADTAASEAQRTVALPRQLSSIPLVLGAQAAMCLIMTVTLVAMYR